MRILITAPYNEAGRNLLNSQVGEVIYKEWKGNGKAYEEDALIELLSSTQANALITEHDHVTAKVISRFPNLQFIGVCRGTPSNVDLEAAASFGIPVFHTPARNAQAVAEMFLSNVICMMRNTIASWQWLTAKNWEAGAHTSYLQFKGQELAGKTVGMVGFGAVGQTIAALLKVFPCPVKFYDPYFAKSEPGIEKTTLEDVFETCDIISIHLPANEHTKGMIGASLIAKMKSNAIFVNTARASVVDRHALLAAIEEGKISGAILDVFDHEPPDEIDYRLINHKNVLATPHTAGATHEVEDHHVNILNAKILQWASVPSQQI